MDLIMREGYGTVLLTEIPNSYFGPHSLGSDNRNISRGGPDIVVSDGGIPFGRRL